MVAKKFAVLLILVLVSFPLVSANALDEILLGIEDGVSVVLGDIYYGGPSPSEVFLVKLLIFILLFAIIFYATKRVPGLGDNKAIVVVISLAVSLIAIRYMTTPQIINFIWLPYGTLGVALSALLPFILGFLFLQSFESDIIRKVGWSAFVVIFAGLAYARWDDLATPGGFNLAWLYLIIAGLSLILMLFDRTVHSMMLRNSIRKIRDRKKRIQAAKLAREIDELREELAQTTGDRARRDIKREIESKNRTLDDLMKS